MGLRRVTLVLWLATLWACGQPPDPAEVARAAAEEGRWHDALDELETLRHSTGAVLPYELEILRAECLVYGDQAAEAVGVLTRLLPNPDLQADDFIRVCDAMLAEEFEPDGERLLESGRDHPRLAAPCAKRLQELTDERRRRWTESSPACGRPWYID